MVIQEELIYSCLGGDALSPDGKYKIKIFEMGEQFEIEIDDQIIVMKDGDKTVPFFLNTNGNDIWAYIFEKAYAYKFGLYSLIADGEPYEVLSSFLDGEYKVIELSSQPVESTWKLIKSILGAKEANPSENKEEVKEYVDFNLLEKRKTLMIMMNESSSGERIWFKIGEYKIMNSKEKKKYLKLMIVDEGFRALNKVCLKTWQSDEVIAIDKQQYTNNYFWIPLEDLEKHFARISINSFKLMSIKPEYQKSVLKMCLDGDHSCLVAHFEVSEASDKFLFGIHQKHKSYFASLGMNYGYSNLRAIIIRLDHKPEVETQGFSKELLEIFASLNSKIVA
jgi:hypothetical protein